MRHDKHIAFITGYLRAGGAERVISMLANYFVNCGYRVSVVYLDDKKDFYSLDDKIEKHQVIYNRGSKHFFSGLLNTIERVVKLRNKLVRIKADIAIGFITDVNVLTVLACLLTDISVIISVRTNPFQYRIPARWKIASRLLYRFADKVVLQTHRVSRFFSFLPKSKIEIIPNPLNNMTTPENISEGKLILAVGRLEYAKGFDLLIEAFAKSRAKNSWQLIIAGEGNERENLERKITEYELTSKIHLPGIQKDITSLYSRASLFVLSSRYEGYPNALAEAMGSGLPCISFNCEFGPQELIKNNINGILVEPGNVSQLANAIDDLAENPGRRKEIGKNATEVMKTNNIITIAEKWEEVIDGLFS
ncbi:MAG: glycosyltransferase family 4 protein [Bacteroidales bacterium]